jgi:hypothetical protein
MGLWDVEAPTFSRQSAHRWRWGCQPYAPAALYPPGRFLILISVRGWVDPRAIVRMKRLGQLKKSNDLICNRTRDLPVCSIGTTVIHAVIIRRSIYGNLKYNHLLYFLWIFVKQLHCLFHGSYDSTSAELLDRVIMVSASNSGGRRFKPLPRHLLSWVAYFGHSTHIPALWFRLGGERFLSDPLQFVVHYFYHSTQYNLP